MYIFVAARDATKKRDHKELEKLKEALKEKEDQEQQVIFGKFLHVLNA